VSSLFAEPNVRFVLRTLYRLGAPERDAEDLAQEVFVIAHRRASEFDPSRRPEPWLYGIAKNVMREHWRRASTRNEVLGPETDAAELAEGTQVQDTLGSASTSVLRRAIAALPESERDVLILSDLVELTLVETATELAIPVGTAKDRLKRARGKLEAAIRRVDKEVSRV